LGLGYNEAFFSLSLVGPILSYINDDVSPVPYYIWISTAWTMTSAVSVTVAGRMMDIFGRRYLMIRENLICVIGCTVAATAKTVGVVICGTTILALGCGPQLQATAYIAEFVPKKLRPVVTGVVAFSLFVPSVFGTPIGRDLHPGILSCHSY
jgi:MFS family permease